MHQPSPPPRAIPNYHRHLRRPPLQRHSSVVTLFYHLSVAATTAASSEKKCAVTSCCLPDSLFPRQRLSFESCCSHRMDRIWHLATAASSSDHWKHGTSLLVHILTLVKSPLKGTHALIRADIRMLALAKGHTLIPGLMHPTCQIS